jgi:competence protein ComEC
MRDSSEDSGAPRLLGRAPALIVVLAFVVGIVADAKCHLSGWFWWTASALALAVSLGIQWWNGQATWLPNLSLLIAVAGAGATRHHDVDAVARENHIGVFARHESRPARIIGTIERRPLLIRESSSDFAPPWGTQERSLLVVRCQQLRDGDRWIDVTGHVRVEVTGLTTEYQVGDQLELLGRLFRPLGPRNSGEFNLRQHLRDQGIQAILRCRSVEATRLRHRPNDPWTWFRRQIVATREHCESLLRELLPSDTATVALALLLGTRTRMAPERYEAFIESGTMHVLAISGLNVAILAMFISLLCRVLNVSRGVTAVAVLSLVGGYTAITDAGPPVVRAAILVVLSVLGWLSDRPAVAKNLLAATALFVLIWNPRDAFNTGAQLSFLAVAVILWYSARQSFFVQQATLQSDAVPSNPAVLTEAERARELAERLAFNGTRKIVSELCSRLIDATKLTTFIWVFTSLLIAKEFHLVSPVGLLANIPLLPVAMVALCCGYSMLLIGFVSPLLASLIAMPLEWSLRGMLWIVDIAARWSCGHRYVPTPPTWWLLGAGLCLATLLLWHRVPLIRHRGCHALLAWSVMGLLVPLWPRAPGPLRVTFLAVGHGLSVLIESPSGQSLLYDAGTMGTERRAKDIVQQALWHRGLGRLDGLVLSHADRDHINGVPSLLRTIPVARVFVSPQFLDWTQPAVRQVLDLAKRCGIPIRLLWQSDQLRFDSEIVCRVLHPTANEFLSPDNANSLVLSLEYAGRRFLLTGDLERDGLLRLLQTSPQPCDVLLAPHHGSLGANTTDLARWACPRWLIVSGDHRANLDKLRTRFGPDTRVLSTHNHGAITFEIHADGRMTCETFCSGHITQDDTTQE